MVSHVDVVKIPAPKVLEPRGGNLPRIDEGAQLDVWIVGHTDA